MDKMKKFKLILTITILTTIISSCKKNVFNSIVGKGGTVTETRQITGFNSIELSIDANVVYTQDASYYIEISGQENVLDVLTTEVSGGELEIEFRKWVRKHSNITIIIHSPEIKEFEVSGSGNIETSGPINTTDMDLDVSGSGNIVISSLATNDMEANISGSGNIYVNGGTVTNQEVKISGSGNIDFEYLQANNSACKISGSGSITVWVLDQLDATISGSGDVKYTGSPIVNTHISGSGSVIHF